jgi:hypothetical protein
LVGSGERILIEVQKTSRERRSVIDQAEFFGGDCASPTVNCIREEGTEEIGQGVKVE